FQPSAMLYFARRAAVPTHRYPLSLHDALPIWARARRALDWRASHCRPAVTRGLHARGERAAPRPGPALDARADLRRARGYAHVGDRKSTRLNSSHVKISYAVFCLKKKK